jgi:hypothetical protein
MSKSPQLPDDLPNEREILEFLLGERDPQPGRELSSPSEEQRRQEMLRLQSLELAKQHGVPIELPEELTDHNRAPTPRAQVIAQQAEPEMASEADAAIQARANAGIERSASGDMRAVANIEITARVNLRNAFGDLVKLIGGAATKGLQVSVKVGRWVKAKVSTGEDDED